MRIIHVSVALPILVATFVLGTFMTTQSVGQAGPDDCCVASMNLGKVLDQLDYRADIDRRMDQMLSERKELEGAWQSILESWGKHRDELRDGGAAIESVRAAEEQLVRIALEFDAWKTYAAERLDTEYALLLTDLDREIRRELNEMSQANGYSMVIRDDSGFEIGLSRDSQLAKRAQVLQQMGDRRVFYAAGATDITTDLVVRMNNAWNAGSRRNQPAPEIGVPGGMPSRP